MGTRPARLRPAVTEGAIMAEHGYRWVIVAAGGLMGCVAMGAMFSLPVLLTPMVEATGWTRTGISGAMTIGFLAMAATAKIWSARRKMSSASPSIRSTPRCPLSMISNARCNA